MGEQDTIRLFDLPSNKEDIAQLIAEIKKLDEAARSISGISIFGKTGNAAEARQQQQQFAAGLEQIAELQAKMIDLENQLSEARKRGGSNKPKNDEEIRSQIEVAEARRKSIASIKDQIKWNEAEADSMVRKRIELKQIKAVYVNLSPEKQAMETGQAMINQMKTLSDELLKQESSYGQHGRNVGNYSGALKVLEEQLQKTTAQMANMEAKGKGVQDFGARTQIKGFGTNQWQNNGPSAMGPSAGTVSILNEDAQAYMKLGQQAQWLNTIIQKQEGGFSSVTMQIRASERALISMREAGLEGTEAFEALRMETVAAARDMKEFQRQQKLLESELPGLKALTLAAKGLGGAYAIGSGAANLFADSNEKLQEKIGKMMAVMMILQGLEEAWQLVNQAGAAAMAFKATAMEAGAVATELYTFVTEGATAATIALNAALVASGIGAVLVALGGLIYLLSKASVDTNQLYEAQTKLNESYKEYYGTLIKSNEALGMELEKQDEIGKKAEEIQAINVRSIQDQKNLNAAKKVNAEADKKRAAEEMEEFKKKIDSADDLQGQYDSQLHRVKSVQALLNANNAQIKTNKQYGDSTSDLEDNNKELDNMLKREQSAADLIKGKLDRYNELVKLLGDADQALKVLQAEDEKFAHELYERKVKALTEITNLLRQQSADMLAMQTTADLGQGTQMKALEAEKMLREKIITSSRDQELRNEALTGEERQLIRAKANQELFNLGAEFIGREAQIKYNARNEDITEEGKTQEELLKMREQFFARQIEQAQTHAANQKSFFETQRDGELKGLLETHEKKNPTGKDLDELRKYNERKLAIETEYNNKILLADEDMNRIQIALNNARITELQSQTGGTDAQKQQRQKEIDTLSSANNTRSVANKNIELQVAQNTAAGKSQIEKDALDKKMEAIDRGVEYEKQASETVTALVQGAYERQLNMIDRQIRKNNELKETETARIQNSTLSETQRAAASTRLALETDQRNQVLERKKRQVQIKEAEFDRAKGILDVGINTGVGIMKAVADFPETGGMPWVAIIAAMGAAQLAGILAKPIPKFEAGTDFSPEGIALVHPGEMRIDPSGKISMTPEQPSHTYLERGTRIIPRHRADMMNDILLASIFSDNAPVQDNRLYNEMRGVRDSNIQLGRDIVAAIKKQRAPETHVHVDANFLTYIKTCL